MSTEFLVRYFPLCRSRCFLSVRSFHGRECFRQAPRADLEVSFSNGYQERLRKLALAPVAPARVRRLTAAHRSKCSEIPQ